MLQVLPDDTVSEPEPPPIIYHYTSHEGLIGIVGSKKLWLSNAAYLNDTSEFTHGWEVVEDVVAKHRESATDEDLAFFEALEKRRPQLDPYSIYVASFSEDGDMLSQWTGYTDHGNGYSIGFSSVVLKPISRLFPFDQDLRRCLYSKDKQRCEVTLALQSVLYWLRNGLPSEIPAEVSSGIDLVELFFFSVNHWRALSSINRSAMSENGDLSNLFGCHQGEQ